MLFKVWVALCVGAAGCSYDYAALSGTKADASVPGSGGAHVGSGGATPGTGGSGGAASGGAPGTGGAPLTGGVSGSGGRQGAGGVSVLITGGSGGVSSSGGHGGAAGGANMNRTGGGAGGTASGGGGASVGGRGGAGTGGAASGGVGGGASGGGSPNPVLWYRFDEDSGTTANDSGTSGGPPRPGTLMTFGTAGAVAFSTTKIVGTHSLAFAGNQNLGGGYVVAPSLHDLAPGAITLSVWIYPTVNSDWERVYDFGTGTNITMFLTTSEGQDANNFVRFAITVNGSVNEQRITASRALSVNQWNHVTVVLNAGSPYTGYIYVNGAQSGSNTAMTLHPSDLGVTTGNYLGRSAYAADWYYSGYLDDFRVYNRALTAAEVMTVYNAR